MVWGAQRLVRAVDETKACSPVSGSAYARCPNGRNIPTQAMGMAIVTSTHPLGCPFPSGLLPLQTTTGSPSSPRQLPNSKAGAIAHPHLTIRHQPSRCSAALLSPLPHPGRCRAPNN